jgi:hydrogenase maturation protein HypF
MHPDFYSTKIASEFNVPIFSVQHHHAHIAACAAEHAVIENASGIALDGFGLGENSENRGGELIHYQGSFYEHLGSFKPLMQPGGDIVAKQPWRMAASVLFELGETKEITKRFGKYPHAQSMIELMNKGIHAPLTSSCGRLFDAASALLNLCEIASYEGEAAMILESQVTELIINDEAWNIDSNQLSMLPLFKQLLDCDSRMGANLFHGTLASALVAWIKMNVERKNLKTVLLSGGCFLNKVLSEWMIQKLKELQINPMFPRQCPPNDGGISLGQAWIAGNKMMENS